VRENAKKSACADTRAKAQEFAFQEQRNLERIGRQLLEHRFKFEPQQGVLISKPGKTSKRPIVIAPVPSRIVQRAMLDIIQEDPGIDAVLKRGHNFGGVVGHGLGVPAAIKAAWSASKTHGFYIRTDIKSFFTKVPRALALQKVTARIGDVDFNNLLKDATDVELIDVESMGSDVMLFPLSDEGVAQGSCLSPLLCNLLLDDFDTLMNRRGVECIRYIDDFILFAKNQSNALHALDAGLAALADLGLGIYDPRSSDQVERTKSAMGLVSEGFTFLGCDVRNNRVRPSRSNRTALKEKIASIYETALGAMHDPQRALKSKKTYTDAIQTASLTIRGWGNTHAFCNDDALMKTLDVELGELFEKFHGRAKARLRKMDARDRRRALGLFLLEDCNREEGPDSLRARAMSLRSTPQPSPSGSRSQHATAGPAP
jgi:hypothetical protein